MRPALSETVVTRMGNVARDYSKQADWPAFFGGVFVTLMAEAVLLLAIAVGLRLLH
jgi:hypothetical protein